MRPRTGSNPSALRARPPASGGLAFTRIPHKRRDRSSFSGLRADACSDAVIICSSEPLQTLSRFHVGVESSAPADSPLLSKAQCQREARNRWDLCLLMSSTVFSFFQKNNGAHASKGPCQAGFSQSFYSLRVSRDVLKGGGVQKGEWRRRRPALCSQAGLCGVRVDPDVCCPVI